MRFLARFPPLPTPTRLRHVSAPKSFVNEWLMDALPRLTELNIKHDLMFVALPDVTRLTNLASLPLTTATSWATFFMLLAATTLPVLRAAHVHLPRLGWAEQPARTELMFPRLAALIIDQDDTSGGTDWVVPSLKASPRLNSLIWAGAMGPGNHAPLVHPSLRRLDVNARLWNQLTPTLDVPNLVTPTLRDGSKKAIVTSLARLPSAMRRITLDKVYMTVFSAE
ncbi:hypothetical protein GGF32_001977 [Allomyces javanicus]|nr:hypothetical protein GGF32_001973 [Allomyces javanicus]KAJ3355514.1 hypothetical protein GGF32_001977 [Allomyces javanicus]